MTTVSGQLEAETQVMTRQDVDSRTFIPGHGFEEHSIISPLTYNSYFSLISIGCVGFTGNLFCLVIMWRFTKLKETIPGLFLLNQSVIDLWSSFSIFVSYLYMALHRQWWFLSLSWPYWGRVLFCKLFLTTWLPWGLQYVSSWNMVALNLERYMMLVHPMFHLRLTKHNFAIPIMVAVWVLPLLDTLLWAHISSGLYYGASVCVTNLFPSQTLATVYGYENVIIMHVIPLLLIVYINIRMVKSLRATTASVATKHHEKAQTNLLKTLVLVSTAFVACWSLGMVTWLLINMGIVDGSRELPVYAYVGMSLACLTACINPFIYSINFMEFRRGMSYFLAIACFRCRATNSGSRATDTINKATDTVNRANDTVSRGAAAV